MTGISAQISLYPLGQHDLSPAIQDVLDVLAARGLPHKVGSMSSVTWGDDCEVFDALREAFARATKRGAAVMTITVSNACPIPQTFIKDDTHV